MNFICYSWLFLLLQFVGSSEKNLREIFDNPPDLYFEFKKNYGEPLAKTALHVIVLDEFDAIARTRGGSGGKGDQVRHIVDVYHVLSVPFKAGYDFSILSIG